MALGEPSGDDSDDAAMPALARDDVCRALARRADLRLGGEQDARLDQSPLAVEGVQLGRHRSGALDVLGQQQLERRVGMGDPSCRVESRAEPKADRAGVERAGVDVRDAHQLAQSRPRGSREVAQSLAHQPPVFVAQRDDVADRRQGDQVEVAVNVSRVRAGGRQQRCHELVRDGGGTQLRARVSREPRMDQHGVGEGAVGAHRVVVANDHIDPGGARHGDLRDRGDRAVDADQASGTARHQARHRGLGEAVAVGDPVWKEPVDVRAQAPQRRHEDRRRAGAVNVVVAVHGDPCATVDLIEQVGRSVAQAGERVGAVARVGG